MPGRPGECRPDLIPFRFFGSRFPPIRRVHRRIERARVPGLPNPIIGAVYRTTRDFVNALEQAGELRRVGASVSPNLEIAQIADRVSKSPCPHAPSGSASRTDPSGSGLGGPALLFENPSGSQIPVLINAFGSYRRMEMALGCAEAGPGLPAGPRAGGFEAIARTIGELVKPEPPTSLGDAIAKARQFAPLLRVPPKRRSGRGSCQEVIERDADVDLRTLPIIKCWPLDGDFEGVGYPAGINDGIPGVDRSEAFLNDFAGRYITLAGIHTIHARDEDASKPTSHNIGMYRVQMLGQRTMAMHWHMHHDGAAHWRSWKKAGRRMPVAIALGGESVLPYAATCPLPPGISELLMAGFLNRKGIELCRGVTVPLWVPANADIVIEGYVSTEAGFIGWDPRDPEAGALGPGAVFEGPFGDHTGFYSMPDRYPLLEVTAITRRRDAIYPTTIVGLPPQEDYYLGKATERIMLPLLKTILPDIEDYDLPMYGAFHNVANIKIRKHYPFHARRVMHGVWGAGQMSWTKCVFVVDDDVDVHDMPGVMRAAAAHCLPGRDIELVLGPLDILDHAAPRLGAGTKIGFDCTRKLPDEAAGGFPATGAGGSAPDAQEADRIMQRVGSIDGVVDARLPEELGSGWLLVTIDKQRPGHGREIASQCLEEGAEGVPRFVIVLDRSIDLDDLDGALFHWVANSSPDRDIVWADDRRSVAFDATPKTSEDSTSAHPVRAWPPLIKMADEVVERVDERWDELGI